MSTQTTRPHENEEPPGTDRGKRLPRLRRLAAPFAALAGVALLVVAARAASENRRRAGMFAAAGGALLGVWFRRRRNHDSAGPDPQTPDVSAEARAHRDQSKVLGQSETNPRGTSGEPDVETETDPDDGDIQFTAEQDEGTEPKPHLEDEEDPRRPDDKDPSSDDDHVSVNISEAAMADEASEATGPSPEQAYPSREGTDPEPTSPETPEYGGEGAATNPSPVADRESEVPDEEADSKDDGGDR